MHKPRTVAESPNLLPLLIQVLASFSKVNGEVLEEEIDSSLGFLRYDYPEVIYSELRALFRQALNEQHDLSAMAQKLSNQLSDDRKIMLGVQLYDLIAKEQTSQEQMTNFYSFMSQLGMAAQAIDIVYQLNASENADPTIYQKGASPLESLSFGRDEPCDVVLQDLKEGERLLAFRYNDLVLFKNQSNQTVFVRGRPLNTRAFCRVYSGQRIVLGEQVLTYQDLLDYFNAKKNVSLTQIFLKINRDDEVQLEKSRSRDSALEVRFGLKVQVRALKTVDAVLNGTQLNMGTMVSATLEDTIVFHNDSELELSFLRKRARAMGGRFQLKPYKSEYLVSSNPGLLEKDDILLSPNTSSEILLKILCDYENKVGLLEVLQSDRPILVGDHPVRNTAKLVDGDTIRVDTGQILRCNFSERIIEEERNLISTLEAHDLSYNFRGGETALDGISFTVNRGEMVCVMGASGSGKSTLLRVLAGQLKPERGAILLNNQPLYENLDSLKSFVGYIPQDDAFDEHLTIEENLDFAAAIRAPYLSTHDRARRIEGKLAELGLSERRGSLVGSPIKKTLSGGERKRLNIGLDMIGSADVFLFDEPTSGLSSKDAEHVIEIIRSMVHNKIILVTIHQPASKLFQMFSKALLLDKGGKLVFYGTPREMLEYFAQAEHEQQFGTELGGCPACGTTRPEFIFDVLETPLRDLSGDIIYEENAQGQLVPARRFSPDYWRDKYESFRLLQDMKQMSVRKPSSPGVPTTPVHRIRKIRWRDEWTQLRIILKRAFLSKLRNHGNLRTTIIGAPALAALIGTVLRYSGSSQYDFASAYHIPVFLFLGVVVSMFIGLTNSADDIVRDRAVLQRERNLDVRLPYYIFAKALTLAIFAGIQTALYTLIGNAILEIRGMFWIHFAFLFITAFGGIAVGLLVSSLVNDAKTALNIVPLVLIPNIILGGALIKYEEMNRNPDFIYKIQRWQHTHNVERDTHESDLQVPLFCEFMPMRWSYEAIVVAQAKLNPLNSRQDKLQGLIEQLVAKRNRTPEEVDRLEDLKDTLAKLSGIEGLDAPDVENKLKEVDLIIKGAPLSSVQLKSPRQSGIPAERLFVNQKVSDLVSKAETEQSDYRRDRPLNVFFAPKKSLWLTIPSTRFNRKRELRYEVSVTAFNSTVLICFSAANLGLLHLALRRQLRV